MTTQYKWLPSEPTEEMIKSLPSFLYRGYETLVKSAYKSMWQAAPVVEQTPVGYECRLRILPNGAFDTWTRCRKKHYEKLQDNLIEDGWEWEVRALYTHPQPKREKLSIEQLLKMHADNKFDWCATARAVEKCYTE